MFYFSVFDRKAGSFNDPHPFKHRADAVRSFTQAVNDGKSSLCLYSGDYDLFEVGNFDPNVGCFLCEDNPVFIVNLGSLKEVADATKA